ncbi:muconolactone Delta-isomerase family protein [Edaphobacter aggregans]|uniref:muconolactone Delta-isomerase family protein n=1 Tax=Edaphobacter aggregans TaxID=570835 RepID=UPI0005517B35|nr:muconolactone Delta-isomerase family protein [Edaphobacter aggregans]
MQFLSVSRRRTEAFPPEAWTQELLEAEAQRVRELYVAGVVRTIWRRKDMPGAVMVIEAASEDEARAAVASLPLAQLGMLEIVVFTALEPYPAFGPR